MNKSRLLNVLEILIKYSDNEHYLNSSNIIDFLNNDYDISANRKTVYNDINTLSDFYDIENNTGGSAIITTPFETYEIKILIDLLNSAKNLNKKEKEKLENKLLSFLSIYNKQFINKNTIDNSKRITIKYGINTILEAIKNEEYLDITTNKGLNRIIPYLLHLDNGFYYLYYSYVNKDKIYTMRLDRISSIEYVKIKHNKDMHYKECTKMIKSNVNRFYSANIEMIELRVYKQDNNYIIDDLKDMFETIIKEEKDYYTVHLDTSISKELYAVLTKYGSGIKIISPLKLKEDYRTYLKDIINNY